MFLETTKIWRVKHNPILVITTFSFVAVIKTADVRLEIDRYK